MNIVKKNQMQKKCPICNEGPVFEPNWSCLKCQERMTAREYNEALIIHFTQMAKEEEMIDDILADTFSSTKPVKDENEFLKSSDDDYIEFLLKELNR